MARSGDSADADQDAAQDLRFLELLVNRPDHREDCPCSGFVSLEDAQQCSSHSTYL